jgi:predicted membrane protein
MMNLEVFKTLPHREFVLSIMVILFAFGGIGIAILLQYTGIIDYAAQFPWGCIIASFIIAYLSHLKFRRDIVTLFTPIYAIAIFFGIDNIDQNILLQVLYAVTLVAMLIRLHVLFSKNPKEQTKILTPEEEAELDRAWEERMRR